MASASSTPFPLGRFIGICAAFALFALIGIYSSRMAHHGTSYDDDQAKERYAKLAKLQADDQKTLTTADWIDQAKGTVRIPIDEAMTQEVAILKAKPVQIGTALPTAAPAAAPAAGTPAAGTPAVGNKTAAAAPSTNTPAASSTPSTNAAPAGQAPAGQAPTTPSANPPAAKTPAEKAPAEKTPAGKTHK